MIVEPTRPALPQSYQWLILGFVLFKFLVHAAANSNYGLHADEIYYITLGNHPQAGYLDNGPFTPVVAAIVSALGGQTAFFYRLIPTIFSSATVYLAGRATFYLGGNRLAICICCAALICSPAYLATGYFLQPVAFEPFFWTLTAYALLRFVQNGKPLFLVLASAAIGLGLLNKYSMLLYVLGLLPVLLLQRRKKFRYIWLVPALLPAVLIVAGNFIWQASHDFPFVRYLSVLREKTVPAGPWHFLLQQLLAHGSGLAVWSAGLYALFAWPALRAYRFLAAGALLLILFFMLAGGKVYYMLGAFPLLFAAGAVAWESLLKKVAPFWTYNLFALHLIPVLVALPALLPLFPLPVTLRYFDTVSPYTANTALLRWPDGRSHALPAFYADMLGWQELSAAVDSARNRFPGTARIPVVADGYAVAATLRHYTTPGFPTVHTPDNSLVQWSASRPPGQTILFVSTRDPGQVSSFAQEATLLHTFRHPFSIADGTNIFVLRRPTQAFASWYGTERRKFLGAAR